jgi:hypothetical protein
MYKNRGPCTGHLYVTRQMVRDNSVKKAGIVTLFTTAKKGTP